MFIMRLGFVVNNVETEMPGYTTIRLAMAGVNLGHEVWLMGLGDFSYGENEKVYSWAKTVPKRHYRLTESFHRQLQHQVTQRERISVDDLDVLFLRSDPSATRDSWAHNMGIAFSRMAIRHGVVVVNDPQGLAKAINKMYLQYYPQEVRPKTIITRNRQEIREFAHQHGRKIILKPLQGSGGKGVFLVQPDELSNLNQMIDAVSRDGYVIAQEYLEAASEGDTRVFMMNGQLLRYKGHYAAFRRIRSGGDIRSNIQAGGKLKAAEISETHLRVIEMVRPLLVQDGLFLVGLDIAGDKLMEINVFTPGGLGSAQKFEKVNFCHAVIHALERKVEYMQYYHRNFSNLEMAVL